MRFCVLSQRTAERMVRQALSCINAFDNMYLSPYLQALLSQRMARQALSSMCSDPECLLVPIVAGVAEPEDSSEDGEAGPQEMEQSPNARESGRHSYVGPSAGCTAVSFFTPLTPMTDTPCRTTCAGGFGPR